MADFIFELGHEEVPPGVIPDIQKYLDSQFKLMLINNRLSSGILSVLLTCRRTAVIIRDLPLKQADLEKEIQGPAQNILYRNGEPTQALTGFLKKYDAKEKDIKFIDTEKGKYSVLKIHEKGRKTEEILKTSI
ncbi:MAG: glycine--tRNA ligase subunit beta, partial [bacterium]|nr:glycine--tRNA ligase subunit beta [bacterium]